MKKGTIIFGVLLLLFSSALAQTPNGSDPFNGVDTTQMNKFIGKWEWKSKNNSFTFVLRKTKVGIIPLLRGDYKYIENGTVVINTLDGLNKSKEAGIVGYLKKNNDSLQVLLSDLTRGVQRQGTINVVKGDPNKILFRLKFEKAPKALNHLSIGHGPKQVFRGKTPEDLNVVLKKIE